MFSISRRIEHHNYIYVMIIFYCKWIINSCTTIVYKNDNPKILFMINKHTINKCIIHQKCDYFRFPLKHEKIFYFRLNEGFRDKLSVAINKICLINLIDQLWFTTSSKHVLQNEKRSNAKYERNIYYIILDVHDNSFVIMEEENEEY